jgi:hypothetical protein
MDKLTKKDSKGKTSVSASGGKDTEEAKKNENKKPKKK